MSSLFIGAGVMVGSFRFLIGATAILVVGLAAFGYYEIHTSDMILSNVLGRSGVSLAEAVARGGENAMRAHAEIEGLVAERLLNNARLIRDLEPARGFSDSMLFRISRENDLFRINIFDSNGLREASNAVSEGYNHRRRNATAEIEGILSGEIHELVIGLKTARFETGNRFAAAIARNNGGAIVVNIDATRMLAFRKAAGIGRLFQEIGENPGVVYAVLQDREGVLVASKDVAEMPAIGGDPFLEGVLTSGVTQSREVQFETQLIFETAMPFGVEEKHRGLLRIGILADVLQAQRVRVRWRLGILSVLVVLLFWVGWRLWQAQHERVLLQDDLKRRDRLTAMGELASGVAHEVRNPLNAIAMSVQRLDREFEPACDTAEYRVLTQTVQNEVKRVNGIVQQFLTFARPPDLNRRSVDLASFLNDAVEVMTARIESKGLLFVRSFHPAGRVSLDREQMTQVLVNLLENAVAGTERGEIRVGCSLVDGQWAAVDVEDTGTGIPAENRERIFDLYFTTKLDGTGLGLSLVQRIVANHGGRIEMKSNAGHGTRFRLLLPREA